MDKREFIQRVSKVGKEGHKKYGILPSLTISQSILESAWGTKHIENNIFGIKAGGSWKGKVAIRRTREWDGSKYITVESKFRAYNSFEDSIRDYLKLIGESKRYERVTRAKNYKEACRLIYECGYATDPKYSHKLIQIIEQNRLYDYDKTSKEKPSKNIISSWAKDGWNWGVDKKIIDGKRPGDYATREEVITMVYRFSKK